MEPRKDTRVVHGMKPEPHDLFPRRIAQDSRLSAEAVGLLAYLYSLPHDWSIWVTQLDKWFDWGRDKRQSIMSTLVELGYLELVRGGPSSGSHYRMTDQMSLFMIAPDSDSLKTRQSLDSDHLETRLSGDGDDRNIRQSGGGDSLKNRQSEKPTTGKSGPIQIPYSEQIKHKEQILPPPSPPPGGREDYSDVSWTFLGEDAKLGPKIKNLLLEHGDDYEGLWRSLFGDGVSAPKLAMLYTSAETMLRFASAAAITEVRSTVPGKQGDYMSTVLQNMKPIPRRGHGKSRRVPEWIRMQAESGIMGETAKEVCISEFAIEPASFTAIDPAPGMEEIHYRVGDVARGQILA